MSAWVVSKEHIDAMVQLAMQYDENIKPDDLGQVLVNECVASVKYRYPGDTDETLPGPGIPYWLKPYRWKPLVGRTPTPVEGLKIIRCYQYQTCEDPAWEQRPAFAFCRSLEQTLISHLPGYDEAPWGWEER